MVSAAEAFTPVVQPLHEGDGSRALIGTRNVYFDGSFQETRIYDRELLRPGDTFAGPAIVSEYSSATVLPFGDVLRVDGLGNLVIEVHV
jgi:N-methylhydantoinase A